MLIWAVIEMNLNLNFGEFFYFFNSRVDLYASIYDIFQSTSLMVNFKEIESDFFQIPLDLEHFITTSCFFVVKWYQNRKREDRMLKQSM
jgi:hypothetical protein